MIRAAETPKRGSNCRRQGADPLHQLNQIGRGGPGPSARIEEHRRVSDRARTGIGQTLGQERLERGQLVLGHVKPARHGVAAAIDQKPGLAGGD